MNKLINCLLFNLEYKIIKHTYIYILKNNNKLQNEHQKEYKIILKINSDLKEKQKIHVQFKIQSINIKLLEFKFKNKKKKYSSIHPDGFLFSVDFDTKNSYLEIKIYPNNENNTNNESLSTHNKNYQQTIFIKNIHQNILHHINLIKIYWDNIFIINLKKRDDRKNNMIEKLNKLGIKKFKFIDGIDGQDSNIIDKFNSNKKKNISKIITAGHFACLLSHIKAIRLAKKLGYSFIMILEDDVIFCDNFIQQLGMINIPEYDMLYLGGIIGQKKLFFNKWIKIKSAEVMGAYSYILSSKLYDEVLNGLEKMVEYVDLFYMKYIQPKYSVILLEDFVTTNLDTSDTSNKTNIFIRRLNYIK